MAPPDPVLIDDGRERALRRTLATVSLDRLAELGVLDRLLSLVPADAPTTPATSADPDADVAESIEAMDVDSLVARALAPDRT